ncbi:DUF4197 domain-containing protein [Aridibaculum aurantiacum]|uniref:DUF4197 domain-containing protein n=1 Tax=Aridibaculum aurantiacum TaxID=2810307 RepID=UPI001A97699E|nr:DUF4197 domain-containing protein [Aridibaculum aurantiacum]
MKKIILPLLVILIIPLMYSCSSTRLGRYFLTEADAASAIRQMLEIGARDNFTSGAFSKETILTTLFPGQVSKTLNTINQLGLTSEIDRFSTTLSTAAEKSATASVPIFVSSINNMSFNDAMRIVKNGGSSATDYLRSAAGDSLRRSLRPVMEAALNEYKLVDQWNDLIKPAQSLLGNRLNVDLPTLMAGAVSEAMFRKIAEREIAVRQQAAARTTPLLQRVFSRDWNQQ